MEDAYVLTIIYCQQIEMRAAWSSLSRLCVVYEVYRPTVNYILYCFFAGRRGDRETGRSHQNKKAVGVPVHLKQCARYQRFQLFTNLTEAMDFCDIVPQFCCAKSLSLTYLSFLKTFSVGRIMKRITIFLGAF